MGFVYFSDAERNIFLILDHDDEKGDADEEQEREHEEFERTQDSHQNDMQKGNSLQKVCLASKLFVFNLVVILFNIQVFLLFIRSLPRSHKRVPGN